MITSHNISEINSISNIFYKRFIDDKIIKSPSDISWSCSCSITPPTIHIFFLGIEVSKSIYITSFKKIIYFFSFYRKKSNRIFIFFWSCYIYFCMTNIKISSDNNIISRCYKSINIVNHFIIKF